MSACSRPPKACPIPAVEQPQCAVASAVDEHPEAGVRLLHHFQRRTQRLGILGVAFRAAARRPINGLTPRGSPSNPRRGRAQFAHQRLTTAGWVSPRGHGPPAAAVPAPRSGAHLLPRCDPGVRGAADRSRSARSRSGGRVEPGGKIAVEMASAIVVAIRSSNLRCRSGG